ncbi:hypothetical protein OH76DRAFT_1411716 [Lentinus brumalis]|uniref:Uncharacterized protein n=1 Tax=Lentinus brumalis TaxID=2498619 RepID=A0A371CNK2_9APHY|nr:hypothetical protein OH76DRAFT_1411716 [Polyporus brumalis]
MSAISYLPTLSYSTTAYSATVDMAYPYNPALLSLDPFDRPPTRWPTTPPTTLPPTPISSSEWLLYDNTWQPDDLERRVAFPRIYALAQPDKYPIAHGLHQQLMQLAGFCIKAGEEGVDFTKVSSTISPEELGIMFVCRTCGVDPVDYMRAIRSSDCQRVSDKIRENYSGWWDALQKLYEQRRTRLDPRSYAQIAYALTGPFREQYKAALNRSA